MNRFLRSFSYAAAGISYAFRTQLNFKVEVFAALMVLVASYCLGLSKAEWIWIVLAIAIVLITELINTAIETLVDLVSPEYNTKAGIIKDISAGVVLISSIFAVLVAILILLPKILHAA